MVESPRGNDLFHFNRLTLHLLQLICEGRQVTKIRRSNKHIDSLDNYKNSPSNSLNQDHGPGTRNLTQVKSLANGTSMGGKLGFKELH